MTAKTVLESSQQIIDQAAVVVRVNLPDPKGQRLRIRSRPAWVARCDRPAIASPSHQPLAMLYQKVPVKVASEWDTDEVGNAQVDFVAHCGRSMGSEFANTLSAVDTADARSGCAPA
ncbi:MAG TPA: hypothetical protein VN428_15205 [Bryobacteraceae bacterium]|nr:hypothetical protein [Bryobacteraceae bacterium]